MNDVKIPIDRSNEPKQTLFKTAICLLRLRQYLQYGDHHGDRDSKQKLNHQLYRIQQSHWILSLQGRASSFSITPSLCYERPKYISMGGLFMSLLLSVSRIHLPEEHSIRLKRCSFYGLIKHWSYSSVQTFIIFPSSYCMVLCPSPAPGMSIAYHIRLDIKILDFVLISALH